MFSYHRVFSIFGRSIQDKTLQCDWCVLKLNIILTALLG